MAYKVSGWTTASFMAISIAITLIIAFGAYCWLIELPEVPRTLGQVESEFDWHAPNGFRPGFETTNNANFGGSGFQQIASTATPLSVDS